jgi:hypothetical protein
VEVCRCCSSCLCSCGGGRLSIGTVACLAEYPIGLSFVSSKNRQLRWPFSSRRLSSRPLSRQLGAVGIDVKVAWGWFHYACVGLRLWLLTQSFCELIGQVLAYRFVVVTDTNGQPPYLQPTLPALLSIEAVGRQCVGKPSKRGYLKSMGEPPREMCSLTHGENNCCRHIT